MSSRAICQNLRWSQLWLAHVPQHIMLISLATSLYLPQSTCYNSPHWYTTNYVWDNADGLLERELAHISLLPRRRFSKMSLGEERHCMLRPLDTLLVMARLSRRKGGVSSSTCGCCWHLSAGWRHDPGAWGGGCPPGPHGSGARAENVAGGAARAALGHAGRDAGLAAAPASLLNSTRRSI